MSDEVPLPARLRGVRRRARGALLLFGLASLMLAVTAGASSVVLLDYLLALPPAMRIVLGALLAIAWFYVGWRFVWRAGRLPISDESLALKLETRFPVLGDRLVSAVSFLAGPALGESPAMARAVTRETRGLAMGLPLEGCVNWRPARQALIAAAVLTAIVASVAWWHAELSALALRRYVHPFSAPAWPKNVLIEPLTANLTVALGEAADLRMRVRRGADPDLRGWVTVRRSDERERRELMRQVSPGVYERHFDGLTASFTYYFEAGDDDTAHRPGAVHVVKRPAVLSAVVRFTAPPYVESQQEKAVRLTTGVARAVVASKASVEIETTKPVAVDSNGQPTAWMQFDDRRLPLALAGEDAQQLTGQFELRRTGLLEVHLVDREGLDNRDRTPYRIVAVADRVPVVSIVEPRGTLEVTPQASVEVSVSAEDDWAVTDLWIDAQVQNTPQKTKLPLAEHIRFGPGDSRSSAGADLLWDLSSLQAQPDDVIAYQAKGTDNFALDGATHPPGESLVMRLKVISKARFAERLRDEFRLLRKRIAQILAEQQTIKDESDAIREDLSEAGRLTPADREAIASLSSRQGRLAGRSANLSRRFHQTRRRMILNRIEDPDGLNRLSAAADALQNLATHTMDHAAQAMRQAGEASEPDQQRDSLGQAAVRHQEAIDILRSLMDQMDRWGNFKQVLRKVAELLDRQEDLRRQTAELGSKTLGKAVEQLSRQQRGELRTIRRGQKELREELGKVADRMGGLAEAVKNRDPATAQALRAAQDAARRMNVSGQMDRAAAAVGANRTGEAQSAQRQAEAGLREMIAALSDRQVRELAELTKMLGQAQRVLRSLIQDQQRHLEDNRAAQKADATQQRWDDLAREQDRTKRNAQDLAGQLARMNAGNTHGQVRRAAAKMSRASPRLQAKQGKLAEQDQRAALQDLTRALQELKKLRRQMEQERARRRVAAIRKDLTKIRAHQQQLNDQTAKLDKGRDARGGLPRASMVRLAKLSNRQDGLADQTRNVRQRLTPAEVFVYIADKAIDGMTASAGALAEYRTGKQTQSAQAGIIRRIDQLLEALKRDPQEDSEPFASQPGGGRGRGQPTPAIPPAAQLKLLKILQADLNDRTRELNIQFQADGQLVEQELSRLRQIGLEQRRIEDLTKGAIHQAISAPVGRKNRREPERKER